MGQLAPRDVVMQQIEMTDSNVFIGNVGACGGMPVVGSNPC
jgi:hypothetical protein